MPARLTVKLKDGSYSASCSSTLIPDEGGYTLFWYFPPKAGKFAGYASEWYMEWNGQEFERVE